MLRLFAALILSIFLFSESAFAVVGVTEQDGSPECYVYLQKFPNGSVTCNADATATINPAGGGGSGTVNAVKENGSQIGGSDIVTLDFLGSDFDLTETPDTEINILIASAITRDTEWDTVAEINAATTDADFYYPGGATIAAGDLAGSVTRDNEWDTEAEVQTAWGSVNIILATEIDTSAELRGILGDETGTGAAVFANTPTIDTPNLRGKIDGNNTAVSDDDCTGEQGLFWYDSTDSAFEFCNANSGVPSPIATTSGDITDVFSATSGAANQLTIGTGEYLDGGTATVDSGVTEGIFLPRANDVSGCTAEGRICWDSDNDKLYVGDNSTAKEIGGGGGGNANSATASFTNASLTAGVYTFNHALNTNYPVIAVYDNNSKLVVPDEITNTDSNNSAIDLTSYGTISGTWNIRAVG